MVLKKTSFLDKRLLIRITSSFLFSVSFFGFLQLLFSSLIVSLHAAELTHAPLTSSPFKEVWGYLYKGEERFLTPEKKLTDIAYFSVQVNEEGHLAAQPSLQALRAKVPSGVRLHCVIAAPYNRSLMYWLLHHDTAARQELIEEISRLSTDYDGVQIDFESIRSEERQSYVEFLTALKTALPAKKILSVALPARVRELQDGYDYAKIGSAVDRVVIMAYDEHTGSTAPGAIASLPWCKRVCTFAKEKIPSDKLIMGIGLYGRVWPKEKVATALRFSDTLKLWESHKTLVKRVDNSTPTFIFRQEIEVEVHYEDPQSLYDKISLYTQNQISQISLWRLGQEPAGLWSLVAVP